MTAYVDKFNATFQVITDIHLETATSCPDFATKWPAITPCLILSGDIGHIGRPIWHQFMEYVNENWDIVIYVLGNHEFYSNSKSMLKLLDLYKTTIGEKWPKTYLLINDSMRIVWNEQTWAIIGTTAWGSADYSLTLSINDFKRIKTHNDSGYLKPISVKDYHELHNRDMQFIMDAISCIDRDMPIVLVTHFPLTRDGTSDPIYCNQSEATKKYFANELHDKIKGNSHLTLVAGHTHHKYDFIMDDVRYIGGYGFKQE
uniref:Calcineurin-like phosphoesterase domain-containing protein n=1 Tax=viral metagenome TaxID=1070528 RepID=A0A6C0BT48_9ZZZZ